METARIQHGGGMQDQHWRGLQHWYREPLGKQFAEAEAASLSALLATLPGQRLLVLGAPNRADVSVGDSFYQHLQMNWIRPTAEITPNLLAELDALPITSECIDVAVLYHALEFVDDPYAALREIERVLVPEGYLVTLGFNPFSPLGLWRGLGLRSAPRGGNLINVAKLQDWLKRLELERISARYCFYWPLFHPPPVQNRLAFLEHIGPKWWPMLGSGYAVLAKKRVIPLTPFKPRWPVRQYRVRDYPVPTGLVRPVEKTKCDR